MLEPDLKEGRGGLRDVHSLHWAEAARNVLLEHDDESLDAAYAVLLGARVELHRRTGRPSNVLALQEQDGVAEALGEADADALMAKVAGRAPLDRVDERRRMAARPFVAARSVGSRRSSRSRRRSGPDAARRRGASRRRPDPADDPLLVLRAAVAAARHETVIERVARAAGGRRADDARPVAARGARPARRAAAHGHARDPRSSRRSTIAGCGCASCPEWEPVRSRPQRNAYHRFTVDRHLLETVANAAALADRVERPDLLVLGALAARSRQARHGRSRRGRRRARASARSAARVPRSPTSTCSPSSSRTTCCSPRWRSAATSTTRDRATGRRAGLVGRDAAAARRAHRSRLARDRPGGVGSGEGAARRAARRPRDARARGRRARRDRGRRVPERAAARPARRARRSSSRVAATCSRS